MAFFLAATLLKSSQVIVATWARSGLIFADGSTLSKFPSLPLDVPWAVHASFGAKLVGRGQSALHAHDNPWWTDTRNSDNCIWSRIPGSLILVYLKPFHRIESRNN